MNKFKKLTGVALAAFVMTSAVSAFDKIDPTTTNIAAITANGAHVQAAGIPGEVDAYINAIRDSVGEYLAILGITPTNVGNCTSAITTLSPVTIEGAFNNLKVAIAKDLMASRKNVFAAKVIETVEATHAGLIADVDTKGAAGAAGGGTIDNLFVDARATSNANYGTPVSLRGFTNKLSDFFLRVERKTTRSSIAALTAELEAAKTEIAGLKTDLGHAETSPGAGDGAGLLGDLGHAETSPGAGDGAGLLGNLEKANADIVALQGRLKNQTGDVDFSKTTFDPAQIETDVSALAGHKGQTYVAKTDFDDLKKGHDDLEVLVGDTSEGFPHIRGKLDALSRSSENLKGEHDALELLVGDTDSGLLKAHEKLKALSEAHKEMANRSDTSALSKLVSEAVAERFTKFVDDMQKDVSVPGTSVAAKPAAQIANKVVEKAMSSGDPDIVSAIVGSISDANDVISKGLVVNGKISKTIADTLQGKHGISYIGKISDGKLKIKAGYIVTVIPDEDYAKLKSEAAQQGQGGGPKNATLSGGPKVTLTADEVMALPAGEKGLWRKGADGLYHQKK